MLVRWFLFKTGMGSLLLASLERYAGLALVRADWLGSLRSGEPKAAIETQ